jgi:NADP-dependent 3-hydroxy acid dehydrogenase YdfG
MQKYVFAGGTAVITGAASGIGDALAHALGVAAIWFCLTEMPSG